MRNEFLKLFGLGFLLLGVAGCETLQDAMRPKPVEHIEETAHLRSIANQLGLETPNGRTAADLATDIRLFLDDATLRAPEPIAESLLNELHDVVRSEEWARLSEDRKFLLSLKGRRILVLPKE